MPGEPVPTGVLIADAVFLVGLIVLVGSVLFRMPAATRKDTSIIVISCLGLSLLLQFVKHSPLAVVPEWLDHISTALVTAAVLEIFFHVFTLDKLSSEWRTGISDLFRLRPQGLLHLIAGSPNRIELLKTTLSTLHSRGDLIYNRLLDSYVVGDRPFRTGFIYRIRVSSLVNNQDAVDAFSTVFRESERSAIDLTKYDLVREELTYTSDRPLTNASGKLEVRLVLSRDVLESSFGKREVFFREMLQLDADLERLVADRAGNRLRQVVERLFAFRATIEGHPATWTASWSAATPRGGEDLLRILIDNPSTAEIYKCSVQFRLPQVKTSPFCLAQIGEPTLAPRIEFRHLDDKVEIVDFPFFPVPVERRPEKGVDVGLNEIVYEADKDDWIFPRSGVLFAWRYTDAF